MLTVRDIATGDRPRHCLKLRVAVGASPILGARDGTGPTVRERPGP